MKIETAIEFVRVTDGREFYECGCCGHLHPVEWNGDCRDDANRYTWDQIEGMGVTHYEEMPYAASAQSRTHPS